MKTDTLIDLSPIFKTFNSDEDGRFGICTNGCIWLKENYFPNAKIKGYFHEDNPTAKIGESEGGHDFLVVNDEFIVDLWYKAYYEENHPLYLPIADAHKFYGNINLWNEI